MPRSKYSRPCDWCSARKVRCDDLRPCSRCVKKGIECTLNRVRKKCGPKRKHEREEALPVPFEPIAVDRLAPVLAAYDAWYYGWWPVVTYTDLVAEIRQLDDLMGHASSYAYALLLAILAAILRKLEFLRQLPFDLAEAVHHLRMIELCLRLREMYNHTSVASYYTIATELFLWVYYINMPHGTARAIVHLRSACLLAQVLKLHLPATYDEYDPRTRHRMRKLWYCLVCTDRFMCVEDGFPIVLRTHIPLPNPEDEVLETDPHLLENPVDNMGLPSKCDIIDGFNRISQVYIAPDAFFYDSVADLFGHDDFIVQESPYGALAAQEIMALVLAVMEANAYLPLDGATPFDTDIVPPDELGLLPSQIHLISTQASLDQCQSTPRLSHVLALNVILTKFWLKLVVWNSGCLRMLLLELAPQLLWKYPTTIAYDLLAATTAFPPMVFESNGPGVVVKLLGIANGVANSIAYIQDPLSIAGQSTRRPEDNYRMFNALYLLFLLVTTFKTAIKLPAGLYHKIERIVLTQPIPRLIAYQHRPSLGSDLLVTPTVSPIPPIFRSHSDQQVNPYPSIKEELESYSFDTNSAAHVTYL
ncbi:Zn(II)2Cys6 transcription factor [Kocuria palustris]|nr:Zn(II)2Cys6 transcription factor [Kocuria palustris]